MAQAVSGFDGSLGHIIDQVAQEKGIDRQILIETMEAAILKAAQAAFGPTRDLEARFNTETGSIDLFQYMTVVTDVEDEERQISIGDVRKHGLEAEVGVDAESELAFVQHYGHALKERHFVEIQQRIGSSRLRLGRQLVVAVRLI